MVDVLLIQPPIRDFYLTAKRTVPYGLGCIAEALVAAGFSVAVHDALCGKKTRCLPLPRPLDYLEDCYGNPDVSPFGLFHEFRHYGHSFAHIARKAAESRAFLIGISSLFTAYSAEALETAAAVRASCPGAFIVMGGHHPTEMPEAVLAHPAVDAVLRGEGEVGMPLLARFLKTGRDLVSIPGIALRRSSSAFMVRPPAVMATLDYGRPPSLSWYHDRHYRRNGRISLTLVASRGCPMACSYCAVSRHSFLPYRRRPVDAVLAEIRAAAAFGPIGFIDFEDENLSLDRDAFLRLLEGVRRIFRDDPPELRAMNGLYPPSMNDDLVQAMAGAGFKTLNLSLGTVSSSQAKRFNRPLVRDTFEAALHAAHLNHLNAVGYIIVGAPGQIAKDSVEDLLYLSRHRVLAGVSVFYPAPGSRDFDFCRDRGLLPKEMVAWRATAIPISDTTTRLEALTLLRLGRLVNFMKQLLDEGFVLDALPREPASPNLPAARRQAAGMALLKRFLDGDGIWGRTPDGEDFRHRVSEDVVETFYDRFDSGGVCGTR